MLQAPEKRKNAIQAQFSLSYGLARSLLTNGSIATIAATRTTIGDPGLTEFENSNTPAGFVYGISLQLIEKSPTFGAALFDFKKSLDCPTGRKLKNLLAFNLYGDPSMAWRVP